MGTSYTILKQKKGRRVRRVRELTIDEMSNEIVRDTMPSGGNTCQVVKEPVGVSVGRIKTAGYCLGAGVAMIPTFVFFICIALPYSLIRGYEPTSRLVDGFLNLGVWGGSYE